MHVTQVLSRSNLNVQPLAFSHHVADLKPLAISQQTTRFMLGSLYLLSSWQCNVQALRKDGAETRCAVERLRDDTSSTMKALTNKLSLLEDKFAAATSSTGRHDRGGSHRRRRKKLTTYSRRFTLKNFAAMLRDSNIVVRDTAAKSKDVISDLVEKVLAEDPGLLDHMSSSDLSDAVSTRWNTSYRKLKESGSREAKRKRLARRCARKTGLGIRLMKAHTAVLGCRELSDEERADLLTKGRQLFNSKGPAFPRIEVVGHCVDENEDSWSEGAGQEERANMALRVRTAAWWSAEATEMLHTAFATRRGLDKERPITIDAPYENELPTELRRNKLFSWLIAQQEVEDDNHIILS